MALREEKALSKEKGQSLVLILLILVIGAVVAFAIAARTIQDLRRTGQERLSDQAGSQVETILDVLTSPEQLKELVNLETQEFLNPGECSSPQINDAGDEICKLDGAALKRLFDEFECDNGEVQIRFEGDIVDKAVNQDEVLEVNLGEPTADGVMNLSWTGYSGGLAEHIIVKMYGVDASGSGNIVLQKDISKSFRSSDAADAWGETVIDGASGSVSYDVNSRFARIRVLEGGALITLTGAPPQDLAIKATCYISGVYREFVRKVPLYDSVPACFDYVLFDGSTSIDDFSL